MKDNSTAPVCLWSTTFNAQNAGDHEAKISFSGQLKSTDLAIGKLPQLLFLISRDGQHYGLDNWPELERWARSNSVPFREADDYAKRAGVSEIDRLKIIVAVLLKASEADQQARLFYAERFGP
jgi:hypothetical protein